MRSIACRIGFLENHIVHTSPRILDIESMAKPKQTAPPPARPTVEVVDPRWLLKAAAVTLLFALFCAWATLCLLFYQGQWQFALQPTHAVMKTPKDLGLAFEPVRFGVDASGTPQMSGWWIPSDTPGALTALYLHSGSGNLADTLPTLRRLHTARLNVFVFDYRGFGESSGQHPTEGLMQQDAISALEYLTVTRHIAAGSILPFGEGVGASLAALLATQHHELPAIILDNPAGDIDESVAHDPRTRMIPTALLLHEHFALAAPLSALKTPRLILTTARMTAALDPRNAGSPRRSVELPPGNDILYVQAITRFLDEYTAKTAPSLIQAP